MKLIGEKILAERIKAQRKNNRSYQTIRKKLQDSWRENIFSRDKHCCRVCGSNDHLQLCHITSLTTLMFNGMPIEDSYRDDNLITMCFICHKIQHNNQKGLLITQAAKNRAKRITALFEKIKQERGWSAAWELRYSKKRN